MLKANLSSGLLQAEISRTIGLSRIVLMVGLVFLHYGVFPNSPASPFKGLDTHEHPFATWVNSAILFFFFSAVPLLSMISGWLFFSFSSEDAKSALRKRITGRFKSLYLPLIVWNAAYVAALYAIFLMNPHASIFTHINRLNISFNSAGWREYGNAIFAVTDEPFAFQFWFVRDLFITVLVSPVLWLMLRYKPWAGAIVLCCIWLSGWNMGVFIRSDVPFFFYMGGLIRQKRLPVTSIPLPATIGLFALYITLASARALAPYIVPADTTDPVWLEVATRLMRIAGVTSCWAVLYQLAQTSWGKRVSSYGGLAFFLYSAQWPLLAVVKAITWHFVPGDNDTWMLAHYITSASLTVMIALGLGFTVATKAPRIFALMNGGRLLGQSATRQPPEVNMAPVPPIAQAA
jgi:peptidoglycan/LPS O-acetylase OafA/YrhL